MKFGLSQQEYDFIVREVKIPIEMTGGKLWCFGSRARNQHHKFSDLDLMVESETDLSQVINSIREKLSNSNFPYIVDIVQMNEFADSYRINFEQDRQSF